ncbi:class D beta-lactamase [Malaciobacter halophilus]|uniref:Beta-lactamase n=1 Tax=Malaciobacter halophilus TaxID=197482 RepID=A0A2N1J5R6_9BACT|nr:class D beta-lactamase [Malaciobacter halophilus]AXH09248.1 putative class D beta-lactamase [Malaciobacter halophilus]PKI81883.1 class D beta-lactamase [Malaciobacter halophilus]
MKKLFVFLLLLCSLVKAEDIEIKSIFNSFDVDGTIVIQSLYSKKNYVYNLNRATKPLLPASTFKIPNSLIILNEKLLHDENQIIKWDKKKRFLNVWNQDQTLKTAFRYSCVWCYQKFAKKISIQKYEKYLKLLDYGNKKVGIDSSSFWLDGDIKITAFEQVEFLRKLYLNNLPLDKKYINIVKDIMFEEKNRKYKLSSKTGWATSVKNKHGWYVGFLETKKEVWFFATNLLIEDFKRLDLRKKVTLEVLKQKRVI